MRVIEVKINGRWVVLDPSVANFVELENGYLHVVTSGPFGTAVKIQNFRPVEWRILED